MPRGAFGLSKGLGQFQSPCLELMVGSVVELHQFPVVNALDDPPVFQKQNGAGVSNGEETVGDDKDGSALHQGIHPPLNECLGVGNKAGGGPIEDQYRWIGHGSPGNGQQLALCLGEFPPSNVNNAAIK